MIASAERIERGIKMEEVAFGKVMDLRDRNFYTHTVPIENLADVLREGLISGDFAKRIDKRNYRSEWKSPHNRKYVSVYEPVFYPWGPMEDIVILVKAGVDVLDTNVPKFVDGERLVKWRISPQEFVGVALRQKAISPRSLVNLKGFARKVWLAHPELTLPIYNWDTRDLLWPREMTNQEISDLLTK